MLLGNVVRLQPNKEQTSQFFNFAGASRFAWNKSKDLFGNKQAVGVRYAEFKPLESHTKSD